MVRLSSSFWAWQGDWVCAHSEGVDDSWRDEALALSDLIICWTDAESQHVDPALIELSPPGSSCLPSWQLWYERV